jgi:hypothetical protein
MPPTRNLLAIIILTSILFLTKSQLQTTEFSMFGVSLSHLAHQADLIVEGKVLGKVESDTTEFLNNSIGVEKIIKGNHTGSTINVLTQQMSESVELGKGEHLILFLSKENRYDGYTIIASYQGKMYIDPKGVVYGGLEIKNMSVPEIENNIADLLTKPVNDTINRNATEAALYANDSDLPFSDTVFNESAFTPTN